MAEQEDHREKNILLAKNLNEVKMNLRSKKRDLVKLQALLRAEQERNSRLELEQTSILNRLDGLKKQLDETFIKNTFNYIQLSKQIEEMHQDSIQNISDISIISSTATINSTGHNQLDSTVAHNSTQSLFLAKIKTLSESFMSNGSIVDLNASNISMNESQSTTNRHSISFSTIQMGLNSTFVKEDEVESELNCTFLTESYDNEGFEEVPLQTDIVSNVTVRRRKKKVKNETPKSKTKTIKKSSLDQENNLNVTNTPMVLRRAVKKIDYKEASFRRHK